MYTTATQPKGHKLCCTAAAIAVCLPILPLAERSTWVDGSICLDAPWNCGPQCAAVTRHTRGTHTQQQQEQQPDLLYPVSVTKHSPMQQALAGHRSTCCLLWAGVSWRCVCAPCAHLRMSLLSPEITPVVNVWSNPKAAGHHRGSNSWHQFDGRPTPTHAALTTARKAYTARAAIAAALQLPAHAQIAWPKLLCVLPVTAPAYGCRLPGTAVPPSGALTHWCRGAAAAAAGWAHHPP